MQFKARSMRSKGRAVYLYAGKQRQENGTLRHPLETGRGQLSLQTRCILSACVVFTNLSLYVCYYIVSISALDSLQHCKKCCPLPHLLPLLLGHNYNKLYMTMNRYHCEVNMAITIFSGTKSHSTDSVLHGSTRFSQLLSHDIHLHTFQNKAQFLKWC